MTPFDLLAWSLAILLAAFVLALAGGLLMSAAFGLAWAWRITGEIFRR